MSNTSLTSKNLNEHPDVATNISLIDIWLKAHMAYTSQPAISVAIVYDQELIYANGFGMGTIETGQAATADSIYRIASHSKLFTAISLMQLRDAGKLRLDDPITKHLPWFSIQDGEPKAPAITIEHLLTHTAGLPREAGSGYWIDLEFPSQQTVRERVGELTKSYPAAKRWKYSNLAWGLAGEIVEAISGQTFNTYVQQNILDPLELTSTSVDFPESHESRLVTGYGRRMPDGTREVFPFVDAQGLASATGMSSSAMDLAKFMMWQFRLLAGYDHEVLNANTLREMQRPHWVQPDWQSGWGLGFGISHLKNRDLVGHSGGYPGYLTNTRISAKEKIGVTVLSNSLDANSVDMTNRIFEWMAPAIKKAVAGESGKSADESWAALEGTYRISWGDSHVMFLDGKLQLINPTFFNPKPAAFELVPQGDNSFIMKGKNGSAAVGERVTFELGKDGTAVSVKIGDNTLQRVTY
ncbi:MAG: serine hydrolase domain-containing protein [Anaerolineae bacterium]